MTNHIGTERLRNQRGFTLIELMIAMAVGSILMVAVLTTFLSQHDTYIAQDDVVEMQQNARVAMDMLARDIRSIGFDPDRRGAALTNTNTATLSFTRDNGAGALETVRYSLYDAFAEVGGNDGVINDLGRTLNGGGIQPVAENVSGLEFRYLDGNGNPTTALIIVRAIQVSIMVESANPAPTRSRPTPQSYITPGGVTWTPAPGNRSLFLTSTFNCRNL